MDQLGVQALTRKLAALARLDEEDIAGIAGLGFTMKDATRHQQLVREGEEATECCLLLDGHACRYKTTAEGARQIVSFHMRGDLLDIQHLLLSVADHNIQMITNGSVAWIPKRDLLDLINRRPAIARALWRDTLVDASIFREWVLNVGRRDARTRIAHMLCEFISRCEAAGLGSAERFELPMTQEHIADATGLTAVHVNRMLRSLREDGIVSARNEEIEVLDWQGLREAGDFDPMYLHSVAA